MVRVGEIREFIRPHGHVAYLDLQRRLLEGRTLENGAKFKQRPEDFSIRALWEGLVGPIGKTLPIGQGRRGWMETPRQLEEAVSSTAFQSAIGQLIAAKVIEGYNAHGYIGDQL